MSPNSQNTTNDIDRRHKERFIWQQVQQDKEEAVNESTTLLNSAVEAFKKTTGPLSSSTPSRHGPRHSHYPGTQYETPLREDGSFASVSSANPSLPIHRSDRKNFSTDSTWKVSVHRPERSPRYVTGNKSSATIPTCMTPPLTNLPWNRDAIHFGIRMAVCMTISSLFTLWPQQAQSSKYPQAMWVLITVLFVCWFPSLDAASVVEKSLQRLYGTFIGASVGLLCGFVSLVILTWPNGLVGEMPTDTTKYHTGRQALFLGTCICLYTFIICWAAVQYQVRGKRIIASYNYACILCLLTFYICLMPFYAEDDDGNGIDTANSIIDNHPHAKWHKAVYRVVNVMVGCVLGALLSITVLPRSTVQNVQGKMERQIQLAGQASRAVLLRAADVFSDNLLLKECHDDYDNDDVPERHANHSYAWPPRPVSRVSLEASQRTWRQSAGPSHIDNYDNEEALRKHEAAIQESRLIQSQLGMLKYDPFHLTTPDRVIQAFATEMRHTLTRALRIQHTIVLLDGIVQNDPKHDFSQRHIQLFVDIGSLIHDMLGVPSQNGDNQQQQQRLKEEAYKDLKRKLAQVRGCIIELSAVVAQTSHEVSPRNLGKIGVGILGSRHNLAGMMTVMDSSSDDVEDNHDNTCEHANEMEEDDQGGRGAPKFVHGSRVCALLFLQLVEHLALRSVRLYQSWKYCEFLGQAAEQREMHSSWTDQLKARYYAYSQSGR